MDSGTGGTVRARSRQVLLLELGGAADTTRALQLEGPAAVGVGLSLEPVELPLVAASSSSLVLSTWAGRADEEE